jgi:hypothetical protein
MNYLSNNKEPRLAYIYVLDTIISFDKQDFNKAKKIIAISYSYLPNGEVTYGASIFTKTNKYDICKKSEIRNTSYFRFNNSPINFTILNFDDSFTPIDVLIEIRYTMYKLGAYDKKLYTQTMYELFEDANELQKNIAKLNENYKEPLLSYIYEKNNKISLDKDDLNEAKRVIAITYSYSPNGEVTYGASIFTKTNKEEFCTKSEISNTSYYRFKNCPIKFTTNKNDQFDILFEIRKKMYSLGAYDKKLYTHNVYNLIDDANKLHKLFCEQNKISKLICEQNKISESLLEYNFDKIYQNTTIIINRIRTMLMLSKSSLEYKFDNIYQNTTKIINCIRIIIFDNINCIKIMLILLKLFLIIYCYTNNIIIHILLLMMYIYTYMN